MVSRGSNPLDSRHLFGQGAQLRAAIYARVSTHDQKTLPAHARAMEEFCHRRGWIIKLRASDTASGAKQRPLRQQILEAARRRDIDVVVCWKLDRWGRSLVDLISTLTELQNVGVGFVSLTEAIDLMTPSGRAMVAMLSVFAEFERDLLRERVKAGIAEARRAGKPHDRPATVRAHADKIGELLAAGISKRQIAMQLGISRSSVRRVEALRQQRPAA